MMISPAKILLLALCATAVISYFGEKIIAINGKIDHRSEQATRPAARGLVYGKSIMARDSRSVHIPITRDGHYWVTLTINGTPVRFVVDTGASHISLSYQDAEAIGLGPGELTYNRVFQTANGNSRKAMVRLDHLSLQSIEMSDIDASVSRPGQMAVSLLGMNFLNKLSGFNVRNSELILNP